MKDNFRCPICNGTGVIGKPFHFPHDKTMMNRLVAQSLFNHGFSFRQIAKYMKIGLSSVQFYLKKNT